MRENASRTSSNGKVLSITGFIPLREIAYAKLARSDHGGLCPAPQRKEESLHLLHDRRGASVLLATFGLTLIENLTAGIIRRLRAGSCLAIFDFATGARREPPSKQDRQGDRGQSTVGFGQTL